MDTNKIKLPLFRTPINGFTHFATYLSVILNNEKAWPWFYSNFIQLCAHDVINDPTYQLKLKFFHYYDNGEDWFHNSLLPMRFLTTQKILKSTFRDLNLDVISGITGFIRQGFYVQTFVDEIFIKGKWCYQNTHATHEIFLCGYDNDAQAFNTVGFYDRTYSERELSYDVFCNAYFGDSYFDEQSPFSSVYLLKNNTEYRYDFDAELVCELLEDFLHSRNTAMRLRMFFNPESMNMVFGMSVYEQLIHELGLILRQKKEITFPGIRDLQFLWEHKKCMLDRLRYLQANMFDVSPGLIRGYEELTNRALQARNGLVQCMLTKDVSSVATAIERVNAIRDSEPELVRSLVDELRTQLRAGRGSVPKRRTAPRKAWE